MMPITILLADDQLLFRKGLRSILDVQDGMQVVGEASNGLEALDHVRQMRPNVVLMDIHMPVCDGAQASRLIKHEFPETKVVALTVSDADDDLLDAIKGGADGYLLKDLLPDELVRHVRGVMNGDTPISPAAAVKLFDDSRRSQWRDLEYSRRLSAREIEVLLVVAEGLTNAQIAERLTIVEGTVKNHIHNIHRKLRVKNRVQALTHAARSGQLDGELLRQHGYRAVPADRGT